MSKPVRLVLIACGTLCVASGVIGMFLPLLPTTPFLLLAAACYARSSKRFYDGLLANRWLGLTIRRYRAGLGLPLHQKVLTLLLLWATIGGSAAFAVERGWVRLLLLGIAAGVTAHLLRIKTCSPSSRDGRAPGEAGAGTTAPCPKEPAIT